MKSKFFYLINFFIIILFFNFTEHVFAKSFEKINFLSPEIIEKAIKNFNSKASLIEIKDIDLESCGTSDENPCCLTGDFYGDGNLDFAVLLKIGDRWEKIDNETKTNIRFLNLWLVIFHGNGHGKFASVVLEKVTESYPLMVMIEKVKKGESIDVDEDLFGKAESKHVILKNPGLCLIYCGKGSSIYYWNSKNQKFENIPVGD